MLVVANKAKNIGCVVNWRSRKLRRVVSSSSAGEALAVNDVLDEMCYIKQLLNEMVGEKSDNIKLELITDSQNLH